MDISILLPLFAVLVIVSLLFSKAANRNPSIEVAYEKIGPLLTKAERSFFGVLQKALPSNDYYIAPKVRVGDVIKVRKGIDAKKAVGLRNRIQQKHFDFVICDASTMLPICAVELNDSSHASKVRAQRDAFLRDVCQDALFPLVEIPAKRTYSLETIRDSVLSKSPRATSAKVESTGVTNLPEHVSTSKLAKRLGLSTKALNEQLLFQEYIDINGDLTTKGKEAGGELRSHTRYGKYLVWPDNIALSKHKLANY